MTKGDIIIENISKEYRLGNIGYGTLREDLQSWWAKINNNPDPNSIIGDNNKNISDRILALNNISLKIKSGERLGIIGNNGAGKTTLLKILSRIASPTNGIIKIKGNVAGLIAVGTGFHPELTGRENIYLNGCILGLTKKQITSRLDEIIDFSGVEKFIDTPVKRFSTGMCIRLGFSVAAHLDPDILLVDEVLAVGDAEFRKKALGKMKDASQYNSRTVLFVSHNLTAIKSLCEKVVVLDDGKIIYEGKTDEGIKKYLSNQSLKAEFNFSDHNDRVELKSIRVIQNNKVTSKPSCKDEFFIEIDYLNKEKKSKRSLSINLKNETGVFIFSSGNEKSSNALIDSFYENGYDQGLYRTICKIPGNFLNPGIFTLDVFIIQSINDFIIAKSDIMTFEVMEHSSWREDYLGEWIGVVRPKLEWRTKKID